MKYRRVEAVDVARLELDSGEGAAGSVRKDARGEVQRRGGVELGDVIAKSRHIVSLSEGAGLAGDLEEGRVRWRGN